MITPILDTNRKFLQLKDRIKAAFYILASGHVENCRWMLSEHKPGLYRMPIESLPTTFLAGTRIPRSKPWSELSLEAKAHIQAEAIRREYGGTTEGSTETGRPADFVLGLGEVCCKQTAKCQPPAVQNDQTEPKPAEDGTVPIGPEETAKDVAERDADLAIYRKEAKCGWDVDRSKAGAPAKLQPFGGIDCTDKELADLQAGRISLAEVEAKRAAEARTDTPAEQIGRKVKYTTRLFDADGPADVLAVMAEADRVGVTTASPFALAEPQGSAPAPAKPQTSMVAGKPARSKGRAGATARKRLGRDGSR